MHMHTLIRVSSRFLCNETRNPVFNRRIHFPHPSPVRHPTCFLTDFFNGLFALYHATSLLRTGRESEA